MANWTWALTLALCFASASHAAIYESPSQLPQSRFDYIVVGGGTAGAVIANRLTENPRISVLVLEAGRSNRGISELIIPFYGPGVSAPADVFWNYTTTPQPGYNGRTFPYARGKVLGGSSSVNGMYYTRGASDDYDGYARLSGDAGWSWDSLRRYIPRHEKLVAPADGHDDSNQYNASMHTTTGLVQVSLPGFSFPSDERIIATTEELSEEFPFNLDHNDGGLLGVAWSQGTISDRGERSSSATAYLADKFIRRPNLHILVNAQATQILQTGTVQGLPSFRAVKFGNGATSTGPFNTVTASREVILSSGSIGTPHLLQLSGIGDRAKLAKAGIKTIVNNPNVGQNITDHSLAIAPYVVPDGQSLDNYLRGSNLTESVALWNRTRSGPLTFAVSNHLGFTRLPEDSPILANGDPSAGPGASHIELVFSPTWVRFPTARPDQGSFFTISVTVSCPTSRGSIDLVSSNPFVQPAINPNYLTTDFDIKTQIEAIRQARRFLSAKAWDGFILEPYGDYANVNTDAEIEAYLRNTALSFSHILGGAEMSPKNSGWGVVDPDLKVKRTHGLRVVDASVLPYLPSAHPMEAVYLFAERASDLIKASQ